MRGSIFLSVRAALAGALFLGAAAAYAQAPSRVLVAMDPGDEGSQLLPIMVANTGLSRFVGAPVTVLPLRDLRDAMRATRTGENDAIVGPAHIVASALAHGYELVAASGASERYVLVASGGAKSVLDLKGKSAYFPQEDSLRTYVGRGLLNQGGLSVRALKVSYMQSSLAGLMSLGGGRFDLTVALEREWTEWSAKHNTAAQVVAVSRPLPAGFGVVVRRDTSPAFKKAIVQWITTTENVLPGAQRFRATSDPAPYEYVASLGIFTPEQLAGVKRVSAREALDLAERGAKLVDVRTEREFKARRARGALLIPYGEKSLKEPDFDASVDSFAGLDRLAKNEPIVFFCNGPECWKSYKASKWARNAGYTNVYWLRGGMPEWVASGLPTEP
ncbi:MAG TPA: rhodanese-like domain-containing protein [Burkholderiaceae bacterium]|jgi:rhodanese-related sulfurtransferase/ABC-type phosphate/phosphonate transport system substrate-binding protein|nr:rhodanese-like domain-containing protein [Burkholderiaceae bacterium]